MAPRTKGSASSAMSTPKRNTSVNNTLNKNSGFSSSKVTVGPGSRGTNSGANVDNSFRQRNPNPTRKKG